MAPDLSALLAAGKLEQTCPACGLVEAAGPYCSACLTRTGPDTWYRNGDLAARRQRAPASPTTPPKRPHGRPSGTGRRTAA